MIMLAILYSSYKKLNYQCCLVFIVFDLFVSFMNLVYFGTLIQDGEDFYTKNH